MPIYMDLHIVLGLTAKDAAEAHREDIKIQDEYGCRCLTYWVDEKRDSAFCLIDAPDKEAVRKMHDRAHGLLPHEIIQVNSNVVDAFLGRIQDPASFDQLADPDIKIFNDPAFRIIMVTEAMDFGLLQFSLGRHKADELIALHNNTIREHLKKFEGREVEWGGEGFVTSFVSVTRAVECAISIQQFLHVAAELMDLRIALYAGLPVKQNDSFFGVTVNFARNLSRIGKGTQVIISTVVRDLYKEDHQKMVGGDDRLMWFPPSEEEFLEKMMSTLNDKWSDPHFGIDEFCHNLLTSKSQLYRKSTSITKMSPNVFLREFRLLKSLELLKKRSQNISQTTFDVGFNNPSYFTKCFQKRFGLQPLTYQKALA